MGSFGRNVAKWAQKTGISLKDASTAIRIQASKGVIMRTPVDKGRARGSWVPSIGNPSSEVPETLDVSGQATVSRATEEAFKNPDGIYYLISNLVYIRPLEYGHSQQQAPSGMVRITMQELRTGIKKLVKDV